VEAVHHAVIVESGIQRMGQIGAVDELSGGDAGHLQQLFVRVIGHGQAAAVTAQLVAGSVPAPRLGAVAGAEELHVEGIERVVLCCGEVVESAGLGDPGLRLCEDVAEAVVLFFALLRYGWNGAEHESRHCGQQSNVHETSVDLHSLHPIEP
jgi:hypothetical protein